MPWFFRVVVGLVASLRWGNLSLLKRNKRWLRKRGGLDY
jgi:hypothetical protein